MNSNDYYGEFNEGLRRVKMYEKWGVQTLTGNMLIPCTYEWVDAICPKFGSFIEARKQDKQHVFNTNGELLYVSKDNLATVLDERYYKVSNPEKGITSYFDINNNFILSHPLIGYFSPTLRQYYCIYTSYDKNEETGEYTHGLMYLNLDERVCYNIAEFNYVDMIPVNENYLLVAEKLIDGYDNIVKKYGIIDYTGNLITSIAYDKIEINDGHAVGIMEQRVQLF